MILKGILVAIESYLLGSIPFGFLLYRLHEGGDVRLIGSGNIGATNVLRGAGLAAGLATLFLDAMKGYLAVVFAGLLTGHASPWTSLAAVFVSLGHVFPLFLKFRGGKGVAAGLGAFLAIAPGAVLWVAGIFAVVAATSRYISLASIVSMSSLPIMLVIHGGVPLHALGAAVFCAALVILRHKSNIHRLRDGTEMQIGQDHRELPNDGAARR